MTIVFQLTEAGASGPPGLTVMQSVEESKTGWGSVMILQHRMEAFPVLEIDIKPGSVTEAVSVQVNFLLFNWTLLKPTFDISYFDPRAWVFWGQSLYQQVQLFLLAGERGEVQRGSGWHFHLWGQGTDL